MSESDRRKRQAYRRARKRWIWIQSIALALAVIVALGAFLMYDRLNRTYYIEYTESGDALYRVQYKENTFFDGEWRDPGQSYVSSLTKALAIDFNYALNMAASNVGFNYTYEIVAQLIVSDKTTGDPIYNPVDVIVPEKTVSLVRSNGFVVEETALVDFTKYDWMAHHFIDVYGLTNATSMLVVTLNIEVLSQCDEFESNNENTYSVSVNVPLGEETFSVETTSSVPAGESKVLACRGAADTELFRLISMIAAGLALVLAIVFLIYVRVTRNEDVTYTSKIRKILSAYRSFIQQIEGEFDSDGYQIVPIKTFMELLSIRDTIQSPILMSENEDETKTTFLIPTYTTTKILYTFEIKVDNYDAIYGLREEDLYGSVLTFEDEDGLEDATILTEDVKLNELAEVMATPDVYLEEIDFVPDNDEDYEGTEEAPGVEVVGVVWPERTKKNKVYRYDPNGEQLGEGDMVLVPTHDAAKNGDIIRKAAVAHENHIIDPEKHPHKLKKVIAVLKRRSDASAAEEDKDDKI